MTSRATDQRAPLVDRDRRLNGLTTDEGPRERFRVQSRVSGIINNAGYPDRRIDNRARLTGLCRNGGRSNEIQARVVTWRKRDCRQRQAHQHGAQYAFGLFHSHDDQQARIL